MTFAADKQCDQIGRFNGLWSIFESFWQQLICPNLPHSKSFFVKVSKSIIFLKSFLGNFYRQLAIFSGHTADKSFNRPIRTIYFHFHFRSQSCKDDETLKFKAISDSVTSWQAYCFNLPRKLTMKKIAKVN